MTLDTLVAVGGTTEESAFEHAQSLIAAGFLAFADDRFKIRHDGFREALIRSMSPDEKRRVSLRVGRTLQASGDADPAQVGRHLLVGGEELEGARLLERGGRRAFETQAFDDAIRMLEAALEVYEARGLEPKRCLELRVQIVACGMQCSRDAVLRHAHIVIDALGWSAGVHTMRALGTRLPFVVWFLLAMANRAPASPIRRSLSRIGVSLSCAKIWSAMRRSCRAGTQAPASHP
ncbi:MAG: hypothetical protein NVS3B10_22960 [Polyangiales bacterium]